MSFDDHLRRISAVLFGAGMLAVLLVANTGLVQPEVMDRVALNWIVFAAGVSVAGIFLFPWRRYHRDLFLVVSLDGLCLIALAVYFSGGWESPFFPFYYFVVVFCAIYFSPWMAAFMVFLIVLVSMSPQLYAPDTARLAEHAMVRVPAYLALAFVSWYMAREVARREYLRREYERGFRHMRKLKDHFQQEASRDPLTGLPNRVLFADRLERALIRTKRQGGKVAVLFADLDNFKLVNDSLGHEVGDKLLAAVAERLGRCLRPSDTVARLGGDEFVFLLEDVAGADDAAQVAKRIAEELRTPFTLEGYEVFITPTIGISLSGSGHDLPGKLLREADAAMYRAKEKGKARYEVFVPSMEVRALERLELENDLRRAIERSEFVVHYQPQVLLDTCLQQRLRFARNQAIVASPTTGVPRIVGMEALVRWEHPVRGLLLPTEFIPLAEETNLLVPIGRWVLRESCRRARDWQERRSSDSPLMLGVNLSLAQFQHPGLVEELAGELRQNTLEPGSLVLEITENVAMRDVESTIAVLRELKGLGVRLALDDFGTGHSSLNYLVRRFGMDFVKVEGSFMRELIDDPQNNQVLAGIINLAHTLGLKVIAEGVERVGQLDLLRGLGCDLAQGNYFSEPLPAEAAGVLLEKYSAGEDTRQ